MFVFIPYYTDMKRAGTPQNSGYSILLQFMLSLENKGIIYRKATTRVAWATSLQKFIPVSQRSLNTTRCQFHL